MNTRRCVVSTLLIASAVLTSTLRGADPAPVKQYRNFAVSIYIPAAVVRHLADPAVLKEEWARISGQMKVDKVYLESHRNRLEADDAMLEAEKQFFLSQGVRVAGGITLSDGADFPQYRSFCYTDPAHRAYVKGVVELTARHFDEIILDDFFFVTTKYESDIAAKGTRSWTDFRLELLAQAGRELIVDAAKAVNPRAKVIIKYPNWYQHFAGLGFDLAQGPRIFDGIYTGTETRDPERTDQHLQPYESYQIQRYFENIAPGRNGGGWVDSYRTYSPDRYAEQLWDTVFAKAREITLYNWSELLAPVVPGERQEWAAKATSFNFDEMLRYRPAGAVGENPVVSRARAAGYAFEQVDRIVGQLGTPIGIKSYRPPHGIGEDFLHDYLGMVGLPIDLYPTFPKDASIVLLTEDAKDDPEIVALIKEHLLAGKTVVITSGLLQALQGRGIRDIVELETTGRHFIADSYATSFDLSGGTILPAEPSAKSPVIFPQIGYLTNDAWILAQGLSDGTGYPLLLLDYYGKHGRLYVWTMPDNFRHLYRLPQPVLDVVKNVLLKDFPVRLDGPTQIALFAYDNQTFVAESYLPTDSEVRIGTLGSARHLRDLATGEMLTGEPPAPIPPQVRMPPEPRITFKFHIAPHSYRAFKIEP